MQMERCANAWRKGRPGSQAGKELGERTRGSTMSGARTSTQLPPTHIHSPSVSCTRVARLEEQTTAFLSYTDTCLCTDGLNLLASQHWN